ncbi:hypothetical protein RJE46_23645 [Cedecea neteri]|uniref:Uncharacterized protein n=1 Tax=Cedecea neteri TaxID=158822 RepID=A0AAN0S2Z4_9ENTR|nr:MULTISPECIES: hypothetical protein [Cedecea]AIR60135.1 hypothetical protein LH23_05510 [Cedecea neteri]NIG81221.1 hypothetical protein [Klebsiella sp. Ap-873]WNJ79532.1 hypothetical protein RJE46_23645 [Cedecea neteri]SMG60469.1 hypothetical protein SAMN03159353_103631 [Cedecea sp. NFIX57]
MKISAMLKALANGVNPETGEVLGAESTANKPEAIRMLFALAEELLVSPEKPKKSRLTPEERQQRNLAEGRPAKSHFPWAEEEKQILAERFEQTGTIETLGDEFERSPRAVAIQLEKMGLITAEQLLAYT